MKGPKYSYDLVQPIPVIPIIQVRSSLYHLSSVIYPNNFLKGTTDVFLMLNL